MSYQDRYDISLMVPGLPFDGDTIRNESLGGSETAGTYMARSLALMGHHVTCFTNIQPDQARKIDDVDYVSIQRWADYSTTAPYDVAIVQRHPAAFGHRLSSKVNLLWCHDLLLARQRDEFVSCAWNIDRALVLSDFMSEQYQEVIKAGVLTPESAPESGSLDGFFHVTRNGIDVDLANSVQRTERNRKTLVYAARPERGLDVLLGQIMPRLLEADPEIRLLLCEYKNPISDLAEFYQMCQGLAAQLGDSVKHLGQLSKEDLYKLYNQCGLYVYPTPSPTLKRFREVSCISLMEAQACGLPVVCSDAGALCETLAPNAGKLVPLDDDRVDVDQFVLAVLEMISDNEAYTTAQVAGRARATDLDWYRVAEDWTDLIGRVLAEENDDPCRLAIQMIKRGDAMAAQAALENADQENTMTKRLIEHWSESYAFIESPEAFAEHYAKGGEDSDARLTEHSEQPATVALFQHNPEPRFQALKSLLEKHTKAGDNVLDYGCGHGWSTVYLANAVAGRKWLGIDVDPGAIKWAKIFRDRHSADSEALEFTLHSANELNEPGAKQSALAFCDNEERGFDAIIASDVIEHLVDPVQAVNDLDDLLAPGGVMIITVPYGPWEFQTYNWFEFRNHLWEFDRHDLRDMFRGKQKLVVNATSTDFHKTLAEPMGFHVIVYTKHADDEPVRALDMARKLRIQRPRQTVSCNVIAGESSHLTLRWCLESVGGTVDELIVADCGMTPEARQIAVQSGATLFSAPDPKKEGFETPRNLALGHSTMDWIFWIDTDERLLAPHSMNKYLRGNVWHGYGVRQHHFAVDADFTADTPVRLFRRKRDDGKPMNFYGMVHEHPETNVNEGPGRVCILSDVSVAHIGYLTEEIRKDRYGRNSPLMKLDRERYPERKLQKYFIIRDNMIWISHQLGLNGNRVTPEMVAAAREVTEVYREYFAGARNTFPNIDALHYYSLALRLLNEGYEVSFDVQAQRDDRGSLGQGTRARVLNKAEFIAELEARAESVLAPITSKWW